MGAAASAQHNLEAPRTRLEWERLLGGAVIDVEDAFEGGDGELLFAEVTARADANRRRRWLEAVEQRLAFMAEAPAPAIEAECESEGEADAPATMEARVFSRFITLAHISIDLSVFAESVRTKRGDDDPIPLDDVAHWADPTDIWVYLNRDGKPEVTDAATLEYEMRRKAEAEAEDAAAGGDPAERLRGFGVMLSFLVAFTYAHDCWDWESWRVQRDIIRPATRARRCRYAELPGMAPFVGAATVFMSHCWGSKWGGLVMAACAGAREDRVVWIDMFAVRVGGGERRGALCAALTAFPPPLSRSLAARRCASGRATAPTWTFEASSAAARP